MSETFDINYFPKELMSVLFGINYFPKELIFVSGFLPRTLAIVVKRV